MIRPLGSKVLVKMFPRYDVAESKLNLVLVDKQKHYEGARRGRVEAVADGIYSVKAGDIVWFRGDLGDSFGMTESGANDGTDWRRLRVSEILAVEEAVVDVPVNEAKVLEAV